MPLSARITFRLTPALAALVAARVRQGGQVSDIVREALEGYFGLPQRQGSAVSDQSSALMSDIAATVSDMTTTLADMVSAVSDMQGRLAQLEARLDGLAPTVPRRPRVRPTARPTAAPPVGMKQCRQGHAPYPASRQECRECVRLRTVRYRARKA